MLNDSRKNLIIPGKSIGIYHIGWDVNTLIKYLPKKYKIIDISIEWRLYFENYGFYIRSFDHKVHRICVFDPFKEKILGKIGCGAYLRDFQKAGLAVMCSTLVGEDRYFFPDYPGIAFNLRDRDDDPWNVYEDVEWDDRIIPIDYVEVYDPEFDWHYFTNEEQNAIGYHYQNESRLFDKSKIIEKSKESDDFRPIRDKIVAQFGSMENFIKKRLNEKNN